MKQRTWFYFGRSSTRIVLAYGSPHGLPTRVFSELSRWSSKLWSDRNSHNVILQAHPGLHSTCPAAGWDYFVSLRESVLPGRGLWFTLDIASERCAESFLAVRFTASPRDRHVTVEILRNIRSGEREKERYSSCRNDLAFLAPRWPAAIEGSWIYRCPFSPESRDEKSTVMNEPGKRHDVNYTATKRAVERSRSQACNFADIRIYIPGLSCTYRVRESRKRSREETRGSRSGNDSATTADSRWTDAYIRRRGLRN